MKPLLVAALLLASTFSAVAADGPGFFKKGDKLSLQYAAAVQSGTPSEVTVLEFGPGSWVLVDYERSFGVAGESGMKKERAQMWINFAHVATARVGAGK